jgi:hypothetical protein
MMNSGPYTAFSKFENTDTMIAAIIKHWWQICAKKPFDNAIPNVMFEENLDLR